MRSHVANTQHSNLKENMSIFKEVIKTLEDILQLSSSKTSLELATPLLGGIPEFDSMAVVTVLTAFEEQFGIMIDDDEVDASIFETVGSLVEFIEQKV